MIVNMQDGLDIPHAVLKVAIATQFNRGGCDSNLSIAGTVVEETNILKNGKRGPYEAPEIPMMMTCTKITRQFLFGQLLLVDEETHARRNMQKPISYSGLPTLFIG
ncbi:hypothetical protein U1Q18_039229 [Sarracenia purpurea var. burkii]